MHPIPPARAGLAEDPDFFALLTRSYARLVGSALVPEACGPAWLYREAPFAVVAHNIEADPRFIYANQAAQACFEYPWDEFTQLRSRFSAEPPNRFERQRLLESVAEKGFVTGYSGLRIARSGRRFWIHDGVVWQLMNEIGISFGQAAVFRSWRDA
jgi:PAS domain-containing protein